MSDVAPDVEPEVPGNRSPTVRSSGAQISGAQSPTAQSPTAQSPTAKSTGGVRRRRILDAAIDIFAHKGFEGATWRTIAARAGVTQGLIRFYFVDKEGLWKAAYESARERRMADTPPDVVVKNRRADPEDVKRWLRGYARHVARFPQEARMLVHDSRVQDGAATSRLQWAADAFIREDQAAFVRAVRDLKAVGWFRGIAPEEILYLMSGAAQYRFLVPGECLAVRGEDTRAAEVVEQHVEAVVALFMAHAPAEQGAE